jgi:hypothetical protein
VHFQRSVTPGGAHTLIVFCSYDPRFAYALEHRVPPEFRVHHISAGVWEIDECCESGLWWSIAEAFGLSAICADCLAEQCTQLYQLVAMNLLSGVVENMRRQWVQQPTQERPRPLSSDTGMVLRGHVAEPRTPQNVAAQILGIGWPATPDEVRQGFRRAVLNAHPDRGGSEEAVKRVLLARDVLMN